MRDIIAEAQKARYTVYEDASGEKGIAISDTRMVKLQKHHYHLSK
jgi:DNA-binding LacI/PurR family transcriptional regulator